MLEVTIHANTTVHVTPHNYRNHKGVIQISRDYGDTWYNLNQEVISSDGLQYKLTAANKVNSND